MRRLPGSLDLIGQGSPRLRHVKQQRLAPGVLKLVSDLEAVGGAPPVERYEFAGRHPLSQYVLSDKIRRQKFVPHRNERICRESSIVPGRTRLRGGGRQERRELPGHSWQTTNGHERLKMLNLLRSLKVVC